MATNLVTRAETLFEKTGSPVPWMTGPQYAHSSLAERRLAWGDAVNGIREIRQNISPEIEIFAETSGLDPKNQYAWCAMREYWVCLKAGYNPELLPKKGRSAAVRNWFDLAVANGWLISTPVRGAVAGWLNRNKQGHIFDALGPYTHRGDGEWIFRTLEGNTGPGGGREGDGSYKRERTKKQMDSMHRPFYFMLPEIPAE